MALVTEVSSSTDPYPIEDEGTHIYAPGLQFFVFGLFFIFGGITSLNDVIIPKLKELLTLNHTQAMLVQFSVSSRLTRSSALPARSRSSGSAICAAPWRGSSR